MISGGAAERGSIITNESYAYDPAVELLPGYDDCAPQVDVGWVSARPATGTLQPGQRRTIHVTLDARAAEQGTSTANLRVESPTPYRVAPIPVRMEVR